MKRIMVGILTGAVISGTAWSQTPVIPAQGPVAAPTPITTPKTWVDYITLKGDVRLRFEMINDDSKKNAQKEDYTRDRARIRARLAAEAKVDDLKAGIGLSTGGGTDYNRLQLDVQATF